MRQWKLESMVAVLVFDANRSKLMEVFAQLKPGRGARHYHEFKLHWIEFVNSCQDIDTDMPTFAHVNHLRRSSAGIITFLVTACITGNLIKATNLVRSCAADDIDETKYVSRRPGCAVYDRGP